MRPALNSSSHGVPYIATPPEQAVLSLSDLRRRWGVKGHRTALRLVEDLGLVPLKTSTRTLRFLLNDIVAAERRATR